MPDEIRERHNTLRGSAATRNAAMTEIVLRLYVTGRTQSAARAITTVEALQAHLGADRMRVEIVDVLEDPVSAVNDDVYATPTIFRLKPGPVRRLFGNIASTEMLMAGLQLAD